VNALVGERVSITSRKPQTTRDRVLGVRTDVGAQYIFVDTPGFQRRHRSALNKRMNEQVKGALADVDVIVVVIEATGWRAEDEAVLQLLPEGSGRVILAVNKTDTIAEREKLLPLLAESMGRFPFHDRPGQRGEEAPARRPAEGGRLAAARGPAAVRG
jgi:GTPase